MLRKKGQRIYMEFENQKTGETKRFYGTVESDEIQFWDYTDVKWDEPLPFFPDSPVISWHLFDVESLPFS